MACLNFLGGWGCSGWLWTHDLSKIMTTALIGSLLLFPFSDVQWGHLVCYTPTSQTSISSNLFFPFSSFLQTPPGSCVVVGFVWPQHCPVFITPLTGYPGPPRTCAAPRSLQECAGACNRLCGGHWVVWLTETSQPHSALAAEWGSAWGGSPNHGRCQIPTVAPHNHSHTGPDIPPGRGDGEGRGARDVLVESVCAGQCTDMEKSTFNSKQDSHFFCVISPLWIDFWVSC